MKRFIGILIAIVLFGNVASYADGLNASQIRLRDQLKTFLQEEGFMPEIDSDGDVGFKREGDKYYVIVSDNDDSPMYVTLSKYFSYGERYNRQTISQNLERANRIKGVKILCGEKNYVLQAEMYVVDPESFKYVFYKLLSQLDALEERVDEICSGSSSGSSYSGNSSGYSGYSSGGTTLVNQTFSSYTGLWRIEDGDVQYKNGKAYFEDTKGSGYAEYFYDLPKNIRNEDFELSFSLKINFKEDYSSVLFIIGTSWNDTYRLAISRWGDKMSLGYGTHDEYTKYYGYSTEAGLSPSYTHQYKMIKRGTSVEWYTDGRLLFSKNIELHTDMTLMGFLVPSLQSIELDDVVLRIL